MTPDVMHELLLAGEDDWVSLDEAAWIVAEGDFTEGSRGGEVFQAALMVPGDLGETDFEEWPGSAEDWVARAVDELEHLAWPPMGTGFWLRLTDRGRMRLVD
ncbi:hypothetical protein ABC337_09495 [Arthrobacter sp. 1P04PC]|uniref:hypothetical protein n=1 Tax=unclassified Arthrobacter TaxID=235627 RepID=UPI00399F0CF1